MPKHSGFYVRFDNETGTIVEREHKIQRSKDVDLVALFKADLNTIDHEPLSPEATATRVTQCRRGTRAKRLAAREQLINSLLPLALSQLRKFKRIDPEDVLSVALLAVVEAVDAAIKSYDVEQGGGLHNFVARAVKGALVRASDDAGSVVRIPPHTHYERRQLRKGKPLPSRTVERIEALHDSDRSLDEEFEDEDGDCSTLHDGIADSKSDVPEAIVSRAEGRTLLNQILTVKLNARQASVLRLYVGIAEDGAEQSQHTHAEIGLALNLPTALVKATCAAALKRLRHVEGLRDLLKILMVPYRPYGEQRIATAPLAALTKPEQPIKNPMQKLSDEQVLEIRRLRKAGVSNKAVAAKFRVSEGNVSLITNRRSRRSAA